MKKIRGIVGRIVGRVEPELDRRTEPPRPGDRKYGSRSNGHDISALRAEQSAETAETVTSGGPPHMTGGQWKGAVLGGVTGAVIGAVIMLPVAAIAFLDPLAVRILLVTVIGALAGATAGAVYWGGRLPELEGETTDVDGRPSVGTSLRDPHTDERGR